MGGQTSLIQVVAAAITDGGGRVLLSQRPQQAHQGGLWEFPGGKLEPGEMPLQALARELEEELGIRPLRSEPLIRVLHHYPDRSISLDVHRVPSFSGSPEGREGQPLRWVSPGDLAEYALPAADRAVVSALQLPDRYLITGEDPRQGTEFLARLERALQSGVTLVQLRAKSLASEQYGTLARWAYDLCREHGAKLLLNCALEQAQGLPCDGVHLSSAQLMALRKRSAAGDRLVAASCHDQAELARASDLGLDLVVLSPVRRTASHPQATPLGWGGFQALCEAATVPVYALGGMGVDDLAQAKRSGGQGIAAIGGLWPAAILPRHQG